ncbi:MAG: type 1 glutamine amidotransferase [Pseudomonadota bacterium]
MHIGILQTGNTPEAFRDAVGDYDDLFKRLLRDQGFTLSSFKVIDSVFPAGVSSADGWLITGSRYGAYDDLPWIPRLEDFIRKARDAHVPMVGICFGHQIIAQALGGTVEKFSGGWSVGRQVYPIEGRDYALNAWHQDQVVGLPDGARVIGSTDFCANAALIYDNWAYTVQPHPEFERPVIEGLIAHRGPGLVPDALLAEAAEKTDVPTDNAALADRIGRFLREARHG